MAFVVDNIIYGTVDQLLRTCRVIGNEYPSPETMDIPATVIHPYTALNYKIVEINTIGRDSLEKSKVSLLITTRAIHCTTLNANCCNLSSNLTSVTISKYITTIGDYCFEYCTNLNEVLFESPSQITLLSTSCFFNCISLYHITIPNLVTSFGTDCFNGCTRLSSITIPNLVTFIGADCFLNCINLSTVIFENINGLETLDNNAFMQYNTSMPTWSNFIYFTNVANSSQFTNSFGQTLIYLFIASYFAVTVNGVIYTYPSTPNTSVATVFGISSVSSLPANLIIETEVTENANSHLVTTVADGIFNNIGALVSVEMPSIVQIGYSSFGRCSNLAAVTMPVVTRIGSASFEYNPSLTTITMPQIQTLDTLSFQQCYALATLTIPSTTHTLGAQVFNGCSALMNVYFNNANTLTTVDAFAFRAINSESTATFYNVANEAQLSDPAKTMILPNFRFVNYVSHPPCFNRNTTLLCFNEIHQQEEWVAVQTLFKNKNKVKVKTYLHGYKTIEHVGKGILKNNGSVKNSKCMYRSIYKPHVMVTGAHALLLDRVQMSRVRTKRVKQLDGKWLVRVCDAPEQFEKIMDEAEYEYYHVSLTKEPTGQTIFGVYTNGIESDERLMETMDDAAFLKSSAFQQ